MSWLLWREYRRNRWILVLGVAGILLPYLVAAVVVPATDPEAYAKYFVAYVHSYLWAWLAIAVLVGSAVAGGRADRSAEFVAYLPLPRWRVLSSKLILPLLTFAIAVGVNLFFVDALIQPVKPVELTDLGGSELVALNGWFSAINLPFALACFGLGTWIFLRRREP